jgi:hypothetical protein
MLILPRIGRYKHPELFFGKIKAYFKIIDEGSGGEKNA